MSDWSLVCVQVFYMVCYEQHRPAIPEGMPVEYQELMQECWASDSEARPKFSEISPRLQVCAFSAALVLPIAAP